MKNYFNKNSMDLHTELTYATIDIPSLNDFIVDFARAEVVRKDGSKALFEIIYNNSEYLLFDNNKLYSVKTHDTDDGCTWNGDDQCYKSCKISYTLIEEIAHLEFDFNNDMDVVATEMLSKIKLLLDSSVKNLNNLRIGEGDDISSGDWGDL